MTLSLTLPKPPAADGLYLETPFGRIYTTAEQEAIIHAARTTKSNLLINALAGAAKTTTLEFLCKYLPVGPILSLAFNKRIAEEMTKRLPGHVTCKTMNAVGHRVWGSACGRRLVVDTRKSYSLLKAEVEALPKDERKEAYNDFAETLKIIAFAKRAGYVPNGVCGGKSLWDRATFFDQIEDPPSALQMELVDATLTAGIRAAYDGQIDFDDQIYMPTLFGGSFPKFPLVLVDEAQDLSSINHAMLRKLATGRLIAVGDPWQSIYAFRGAKRSGMQTLRSDYNCVEFPLSVSFRCPQAVVEAVRWRVPHMQWRKEGGHVETLDHLAIDDIMDGSAVICRNNAPLFRLAILLLKHHRGVHLVGTDLGPLLVKTLKKLGHEGLTTAEVLEEIDDWEREHLEKAKNKAAVADKADCLRVFAEFGATLGGAIAYCESLFAGRGAIQLLSGHKSKGLEWETVYHLDPWRIPSQYASSDEDLEQEYNLRYVISTRAKATLFEIDLERIVTDGQ